MIEILDTIINTLERGERLALLTSVRAVGSTPRHNAARMVVFADGGTFGTIGGGALEFQAVADARTAMAESRPRLVEYNLIDRGEGNLGLCGGTQEIFIDLLKDTARLNGANTDVPRLLHTVRRTLERGEPVVLATVVRAEGGASLRLGAWQVIRPDGEAVGSLGEARLDQAVIEAARQAMAEGYPHRLSFDPATGTVKRLMSTRRAPVEIFLDVIQPQPRLLIIGAGHIGAALARQGRFLGWWVSVVDDRPEFVTPQRIPDADEMHQVAYDPETEYLAPLNVRITPNTAVVVATWGWDEPALRRLAGAPAFYVGLVASLRKAAVIFEALRAEGVDPAWLDSIRVPVGLDVGAETPEEIALAIMAEILAVARRKSGRPLQEVRGQRIQSALYLPVIHQAKVQPIL